MVSSRLKHPSNIFLLTFLLLLANNMFAKVLFNQTPLNFFLYSLQLVFDVAALEI